MAAKKITKKTGRDKVAQARRQGALPCLVIVGGLLLILSFFLFASIKTLGQ
jgi:hypothetical protein